MLVTPASAAFSSNSASRLAPKPFFLCSLSTTKALTEDEVVKVALGEHIYTSFLEAKRIEWASYATFVSQWEVDNYLDLY